MNEQLLKNVDAIREEAMGMIDNLSAVKGESYSEYVRLLLNVHQSANVIAMLCEIAREFDEDMAAKMAGISEVLLTQVAISASALGKFSQQQSNEAIKEAERMRDWVDGMSERAIKSAQEGGSFGGKDVA